MNVNKNSRFFYYFKVIIFSYRYKSKRCATYEAEYASYSEETRKIFLEAKGCSITEEKKDSLFKSEDKKEAIEPIVDSKSIQSPKPVMKPASTTTASNSSINSIPSTTSDNMSLTSERSPFFSDSDDDSYQPGQEIGDFDLSHLDDLDQYNESDRFSNEDHEDVDEDDISLEAEALSYFTKLDKNGDGYITKDELTFEVVLDQNNDGQVSDKEVNYYMSGHDNYDQETFLNTGWLLIKHLDSKSTGPKSNSNVEQDPGTLTQDKTTSLPSSIPSTLPTGNIQL